MSEWIRVEDKLPEYGEQVLIYNGDISIGYCCTWVGRDSRQRVQWYTDGERRYHISYWQPLPQQPEDNL